MSVRTWDLCAAVVAEINESGALPGGATVRRELSVQLTVDDVVDMQVIVVPTTSLLERETRQTWENTCAIAVVFKVQAASQELAIAAMEQVQDVIDYLRGPDGDIANYDLESVETVPYDARILNESGVLVAVCTLTYGSTLS